MKDKATFILAILIVFCFLFYAVTFQVDYNEVAVTTTFGAAHEGSVYHGDRTDVGAMGNLHFRWPWPIQQVRTYDRRVRVLEEQLEEQQTLDNWSITVRTYLTWRITDPLQFMREHQDVAQAEMQLRQQLRDERAVLGNYRFDELANEDPSRMRLEEAEQEILERMRSAFDAEEHGIEIQSVGIQRLVLPAAVTANVFERMRVTRERLAQRAESEGEATAENIRARAEGARRTIMAFADRRADAIRAEGEHAASEYYDVFEANEEFAIFLFKMDRYREVFRNNTTFIFDAKEGGLGAEFLGGPQLTTPQPTQAEGESGSSEGSEGSASGDGEPGDDASAAQRRELDPRQLSH